MAEFPARGQKAPNYWDDDLKAYIDVGKTVDLGEVSDTVAITEAGSYEMDLTDDTLVNVTTDGDVTLWLHGTGQTLTIESTDFDIDGDHTVQIVTSPRGVTTPFMAGGGGEPTPPEVIDPPTQPGAVTVDPTADGFDLSWIASTVASGYEGKVGSSSYVDYGSNLSEVLNATKHPDVDFSPGSTHSGSIRAYNSLGEKSAVRNWGPATVDTPTLDDYIASFNPLLSLRFSEGSVEDLSPVDAGTWVSWGSDEPEFDGPPLVAGDTGSMYLPNADAKIRRETGPVMTGVEEFTTIVLYGAPAGESGGGGDLRWGNGVILGAWGWGTDNIALPGGVHCYYQIQAGDSTDKFIDRNGSLMSYGGWADVTPVPAPDSYPFFLNSSFFGGGGNAGWLSRLVIVPKVMTESEMLTFSTIAGTLDNPANGTLP